eukprot:2147268-Pleurochrysis_carterae.AAC.2
MFDEQRKHVWDDSSLRQPVEKPSVVYHVVRPACPAMSALTLQGDVCSHIAKHAEIGFDFMLKTCALPCSVVCVSLPASPTLGLPHRLCFLCPPLSRYAVLHPHTAWASATDAESPWRLRGLFRPRIRASWHGFAKHGAFYICLSI